MVAPAAPATPRKWYHPTLTRQIVFGLVAGILLGWWLNLLPAAARSGWEDWLALMRDIFLHLIKAMIAPLVFASIVQGIAGTGDLKRVGRMGAKALLYFEVITTFALAVGLLLVNLVRPGVGVHLAAGSAGALGTAVQTKPLTLVETILHTFPTSVIEAMARGDVLQIVCFSVIFALAVIAAGEAGQPILQWCAALTQVMFKFAGKIMLIAPFGVGAAMAVTVSHQGLDVLLNLGQLVLTLYGALVVFIVLILGSVIALVRVPLLPFIRAVREPFTLAFATANSEAALPKAFENMERFGVPRGTVGFVLPAGYTFNLDGSTLHLAVASVFVAQAAETTSGIHFGLGQQITMMITLMITSKGVAAVPRASLVILIAALQSFNLPLEGAAMILGVDALMDMARTSVNVLGNCLASVVVARWENEFDEGKARRFGTPDEVAD
ncbi:MAG: dicarboxylate/amino acid:cation symporter [Opitutales bacterium]